jgi:acyl-CoA thioesterase I
MEQTICVFGDSIAWGAWDYELGGWVNRLKLYFDKQYAYQEGEYAMIYNLGVSSNTSIDLLNRISNELESRKPSFVIISIGINDSIYLSSYNKNLISPEDFDKNLLKIILEVKKYTSKILILGSTRVDESKTCPIPWETEYQYKNSEIQIYDSIIKRLAYSQKVWYLSMFDLLNEEDLSDGLHPNEQGHKKIFQATKDFLKKNKLF